MAKNSFYAKFLHSCAMFASVFCLVLLCVCISAAFAMPLWFWATNSASTYTAFVLTAIAVFFVWQIIRAVRKTSARNAVFIFLRIAIICGSIFFAIRFVLSGRRLFAAIVLAFCTAMTMGLAYIEKLTERKKKLK